MGKKSKNGHENNGLESKREFVEDLVPVRLGKKSERGGVCLSSGDGVAYVDDSDVNVLIESSTGTGKSSRVVVESGISVIQSGQSAVFYDPKLELFRTTASIAKKTGHDIIVLNARNPMFSDTVNLLGPIVEDYRSGDSARVSSAVDMMSDLACTLIPSRNRNDPFWEESAQSVFLGLSFLVMSLAKNESEINLRSICALKDEIETNASLHHHIQFDTDETIRSSLSGVINNSETTRRCILGCFGVMTRIYTFHGPLVRMISNPGKDLYSIGEKPTAVYLVLPDEKSTYGSLMSAVIKMLYVVLTAKALTRPDGSLPVRVNFLLDEFSNISPIPDFASMISAGRSRNIRFIICIQSRYQLISKYGEEVARTIISNCGIMMYMYSQDLDTLREYAERAGNGPDGRPLLSVRDLQQLEPGQALVLRRGHRPHVSYLAHMSAFGIVPEDVPLPRNDGANVPLMDLDEALKRYTLEHDPEYKALRIWRRNRARHMDLILEDLDENEDDGKDEGEFIVGVSKVSREDLSRMAETAEEENDDGVRMDPSSISREDLVRIVRVEDEDED